MTPFALTLSHVARERLQNFVEVFFILFVLVTFVCVASYTVKQLRTGRLFRSEGGPPRLAMRPLLGWLFVVSVVGLVYLQSPLYAMVVLFGIAVALAQSRRTVTSQFGFDRASPVKALTWGLLVFGAVMLVEAPLFGAWGWILDVCRVPHPEQESVETFRQINEPSLIFDFLVYAALIAPVIEELFFRGFLMGFLKNHMSAWPAIVLSGGIFAIAHFNIGAVVPLWFLGVVLGVAYEHTGCLVVPIVIHGCFNLATGLSVLLDKGNP
ncbi:MAG TPA: type II CAAX endopeptidase family protein [Candidatus Methylacidiphilales bacterium]|jgi:membrane protease YdiL (CAAX protease family)|nr:type II CAAX endopeptidase family protein [Candidatus Methylacidiphilales bacterium]